MNLPSNISEILQLTLFKGIVIPDGVTVDTKDEFAYKTKQFIDALKDYIWPDTKPAPQDVLDSLVTEMNNMPSVKAIWLRMLFLDTQEFSLVFKVAHTTHSVQQFEMLNIYQLDEEVTRTSDTMCPYLYTEKTAGDWGFDFNSVRSASWVLNVTCYSRVLERLYRRALQVYAICKLSRYPYVPYDVYCEMYINTDRKLYTCLPFSTENDEAYLAVYDSPRKTNGYVDFASFIDYTQWWCCCDTVNDKFQIRKAVNYRKYGIAPGYPPIATLTDGTFKEIDMQSSKMPANTFLSDLSPRRDNNNIKPYYFMKAFWQTDDN